MRNVWGLVVVFALGGVPAVGQEAPAPAPVTAEEFAALGWMEGRWVGSGGGFDAFYEAFRMLDATTLEQTTYPDASFAEPDGRSTLEFRDGAILKLRDGAVESVVTRVAGDTLRFDRVPPGRAGFFWIRIDDDRWRAILDRPGGEPVVYTLRRIEGG